MNRKLQLTRYLAGAAKIAVGSAVAILIAELLRLDNVTSAGTVALLTAVTTKWETIKLSVNRILAFFVSVALAWAVSLVSGGEWNIWITYGVFLFFMVFLCHLLGWKATISVNAIIGMHLLTTGDYSPAFILNEFLLIFIGILCAIVLNLYNGTKHFHSRLVEGIAETDDGMQLVLRNLAAYLTPEEHRYDVWDQLTKLDKTLNFYLSEAYRYQDNTFQSHPQYYIDYFSMRLRQCNILRNLHAELRQVRSIPDQAGTVREFILYTAAYAQEHNLPNKQMERLDQIFLEMKEEPLPRSREEFESRAILYHILMDLQDFLACKQSFIEGLDERQRKIYWNDPEKSENS
ncbi:MAG: aromatic acid exporter family protein [Clostridiales bacterium]|nr:aromatic acid exporter family protein [Clostridiales bacterium]